VHLNTQLASVDGFVGNFKTVLKNNTGDTEIEHGVTVVATGASELEPDEYLYGEDPRVVTSLELDRKMLAGDAMLDGLNTAVFIQCVGSREPQRPYCCARLLYPFH
jgi:heterodisulfide reductase subunit A